MFSLFRKEVQQLVGEKYSRYLEVPKSEAGGDLALPCFALVNEFQKKPNEISLLLAAELHRKVGKNSIVKEVKSMGPYLNFYINGPLFVEKTLEEIMSEKEKYGSSDSGGGRTVIVEYPSANIAKPLSVGHLRSAIIGQSLYNIHKFLGYKVISDDHLGDWGTQFGKMIYAYLTWGDPDKIRENPIHELLSLYVKFHEEAEKDKKLEDLAREWFARLEKGDKEAVKIWKDFTKWSLDELKRTYKRLGLTVDHAIGESSYVELSKHIIDDAIDKGVAFEDNGAIIIPVDDTVMIIKKSDGSTVYGTRDIATVKYRVEKWHPHKIIYAVGSEQKLHLKQVFYAAKKLGYAGNTELVHVDFGLVSLPEGKMSTRKGRVVFLDDFMDEAHRRAADIIKEKNPGLKKKEEVAEQVAMSAIKYNDLSRDRIRNIIFDWSALSFEGDTGPYLQYTAVRANSILEKSRKKPATKDLDKLNEKEETALAKHLSVFGDVLNDVIRDYKPHYLANYLFSLAAMFNEYYHKTKVIDSPVEEQRLSLVLSVYTVLKIGLRLLGVEVPDEM